MRPFRFGVGGLSLDLSKPGWQDTVRRIEGQGFDVMTVGDHLSMQVNGPLVGMAALAVTTSSLHIGSYVLCSEFRNPAILVRELLSLTHLAPGRIEVGVGAGWLERDFEAAGLEMPPASIRLTRLAEALEILTTGFAGSKQLNYAGKHFAVHGLPLQPPSYRVPLLVGGGGREVLRLAARYADIVAFNDKLSGGSAYIDRPSLAGATWDSLEGKVSITRQAAGIRFPELELGLLLKKVVITEDVAAAADAAAASLSATPQQVLDSPSVMIGSAGRVAERLLELRERTGISYVTVGLAAADQFARVVEVLHGQ